MRFTEDERRVYALIARSGGLKAREIAARLGLDRKEINRFLVSSALMREMCYQDHEYRWHAVIRQVFPHEGIYEFSGWYGTVREFVETGEAEWLSALESGCRRIGRNLNDTRGLIHSFLDCRKTMLRLFEDLAGMMDGGFRDWEIAFEFRINRARYIRIYSDVLVITGEKVFSLEFKMKDAIDPEEVLQAAKYAPALELVFGEDVIAALVLTGAADLYTYAPIGGTDSALPVCSGDMLFNVFDEYLHFLRE
ncbi:MAG: helix-turn-helix domain containing protein [Clostridia bacterium]|nr:helix-turn-helix domain containing protein [Clostridia bacterium]